MAGASVKTDAKSGQNQATFQRGVVLEVDANLVALVKVGDHQIRVRADMMRGKSAPPLPGEIWIFDQPYGSGWQFAVPVNFSADLDWLAPTLVNSWVDIGSPNLPVGYRKEVEGWVTLCGKLSGGTAASTAFTLPKPYWPRGTHTQLVPVGTGSGQIVITSTGTVSPQSTGVNSLDAVRFMAAS